MYDVSDVSFVSIVVSFRWESLLLMTMYGLYIVIMK